MKGKQQQNNKSVNSGLASSHVDRGGESEERRRQQQQQQQRQVRSTHRRRRRGRPPGPGAASCPPPSCFPPPAVPLYSQTQTGRQEPRGRRWTRTGTSSTRVFFRLRCFVSTCLRVSAERCRPSQVSAAAQPCASQPPAAPPTFPSLLPFPSPSLFFSRRITGRSVQRTGGGRVCGSPPLSL